jgi:Flp pilus assembly protein TadG
MKRTRSERGSALLEFSLLASGLLLLCLGFIDFSLAIGKAITLMSAAQAGARFGAAEGNSNDTAGMTTAAQKAAYGITGMTVNTTTTCSCSAGGSVVSCSTVCNTYDLPVQYVQVQTAASVPLLFNFAGIPLNVKMSGSARLRAR